MGDFKTAVSQWKNRQTKRITPALISAGFHGGLPPPRVSPSWWEQAQVSVPIYSTNYSNWDTSTLSVANGLLSAGWYMLFLLPMIGALAVGFITKHFASEAKGHGVPEVMDAIYRKGAVIRSRVSVAKAVASAFTIGSGGSAGTEGPIVQIGAAIGSSVGQFLGIKKHQMNTLVACGVAGGIAAIFDAPIAGVLFALEIFLRDFSFKTFSPIVFASVISASLTHALRPGEGGIFESVRDAGYIFNGAELPYFLALGLLCAVTAVAFIRLLYAMEDVCDALKISDTLKPVIGAAFLGIIGTGPIFFG